jgi:hypothetical protein
MPNSKPRQLRGFQFSQVLYAALPYIHRGGAVVVRAEPAFAAQLMCFTAPCGFTPAPRAYLRSAAPVNIGCITFTLSRLVGNFLMQIEVRPADMVVPLFKPDPFALFTHALQVLKREKRIRLR